MRELLLPMPFLTALDHAGRPIANARLYLYESGGTTNATAYTTKTLTTPHDQPILANAAGRFPAIYLRHDTNPAYRAVLKDADGAMIADIDPINRQGGLITSDDIADDAVNGDKLAAGAALANLGFTPVDSAGGEMTGDLVLAMPPEDMDAAPPGLAGFRNITFVAKNEDHEVGLFDVGRGLLHTDSGAVTYSIRPDEDVSWGSGSGFAVYNGGSGAVVVECVGDVELRLAGSMTPVVVQIQQGGLASFFRVASDTWVCAGAGVTGVA